MKKHNLHAHTTYSDGTFRPKELVEFAMSGDLEILGISDHAFSRKLPINYQVTSCLEKYLIHIKEIQESFKDNKFSLKAGIEIDVSRNCGADPSQIPFNLLNGFDYLLFEYVNTEYESWGRIRGRDISKIIKIRDKLTVPVGLAHNDLQNNYQGKEKEISKILSENKIFVELNQSEHGRNTRDNLDYYTHFSLRLLEELKTREVKFVIGTDSHTGEGLLDINDAYQFIKKNELQLHEIVL